LPKIINDYKKNHPREIKNKQEWFFLKNR
jgi:hypothetical protein